MATIVVIGGGISGLAVSYYLQKSALIIAKVILLEGSRRTGGRIRSLRHDDCSVFELGPRSVRPVGVSGINSLKLVDELDLRDEMLVVLNSHPVARNRYLYVGGNLHALPNTLFRLFKKVPPFSRSFARSAFGDLFTKPSLCSDESVHSFVKTRFGEDVADILADAVCRGIFANDCRTLSMRSCFPDICQTGQRYGSVILGSLRQRNSQRHVALEHNPLSMLAKRHQWSSWSLKHGLQQLCCSLEAAIAGSDVCEIRFGTPCRSLTVNPSGKMMVETDTDIIHADHVISAVCSKDLAELLPPAWNPLKEALSLIQAVSVYVVNLEYEGCLMPVQGFGHLLPSSESLHILGVVYDSCAFPQHDRHDRLSTRLTVMLGGKWLQHMLTKMGGLPDDDSVVAMAMSAVCQQLGFPVGLRPSKANVYFHRRVASLFSQDCIPEYSVCHVDKLDRIESFIANNGLALSCVGASYRGVSVNDCIYHSRLAAEGLLSALPARSDGVTV